MSVTLSYHEHGKIYDYPIPDGATINREEDGTLTLTTPPGWQPDPHNSRLPTPRKA